MTERRSTLLALVLVGLTAVLLAAAVVLLIRTLDRPVAPFGFRGAVEILTLAFVLVGAVLAIRRPGNPIGWIFLVASLLSGVQVLAQEYTVFAMARGELRGARIANWVDGMIWVPITGSVAIFVSLLFPTGRLPSRRWRWVAWTGAIGIVIFTAAFMLSTDTELSLGNPFFDVRAEVVGPMFGLGSTLYLVGVLGALASLVVRFRRAHGDERQQLRWFGAALGLVAGFITLTFVSEFWAAELDGVKRAAAAGTILSFAAIPLATGVAVLKYRLYEIDVVIRKTVVFAILATILTGVLVFLAASFGAVVGIVADPGGATLAIASAFAVGLLTVPLWRVSRRIADRVVFGGRQTPYEVLAAFSQGVSDAYSTDDVLPRMAEVLGAATGAMRAVVWMRLVDQLRPVGTWPPDRRPAPIRTGGSASPAFPESDHAFWIRHQGEDLGALSVTLPASDPMNASKEKLIEDLARQAGPVVRNVRLIEELRASRQRLVAAQDEERRRLERNIHDGAQQQLVALSVKMRLLKTLARKDPGKAEDLVDQLQADARDALDDLRDLARGIYPPLLADRGLAAALEAQARKAAVPVEVDTDGVGRYPQEAEATAYFCVLEALQNVAKYAEASSATVRLGQEDDLLVFSVSDDGRGFDPATTPRGAGLQNMSDRVEALGGTLEVSSTPGAGTTISGSIPVGA